MIPFPLPGGLLQQQRILWERVIRMNVELRPLETAHLPEGTPPASTQMTLLKAIIPDETATRLDCVNQASRSTSFTRPKKL